MPLPTFLRSVPRKRVRVRLPPPAPIISIIYGQSLFCTCDRATELSPLHASVFFKLLRKTVVHLAARHPHLWLLIRYRMTEAVSLEGKIPRQLNLQTIRWPFQARAGTLIVDNEEVAVGPIDIAEPYINKRKTRGGVQLHEGGRQQFA